MFLKQFVPKRLVVMLVALAASLVWRSTARAEPQPIGPLALVARINGVEIPFGMRAAADVTSRGGQFNMNGEATVFASPDILRDRVVTIVTALLPYRIPTSKCTVRLLRLASLDIGAQDFEARIGATATLSLNCGGVIDEERDVPVKVAVAPVVVDKKSLGWKVLRKPEIGLPWSWWLALEAFGADPPKIFKAAVQDFLDRKAVVTIPSFDGVSAALQGANVDGDTTGAMTPRAKPSAAGANEISLRIKGDIHAGGVVAAQMIARSVKQPVLDVSFTLPLGP